jgi:hypothetical protein
MFPAIAFKDFPFRPRMVILKEDEIVSKVTKSGLFRLSRKGKRTYSFLKET